MMRRLIRGRTAAYALMAASAAAFVLNAGQSAPVSAQASSAASSLRIVAMRRITEAQYRNTIADIFGPDIRVAGRFEPIVRPVHELIASGASDAAISPTGLENFDAMARVISAQVFDEKHRGQFAPCAPASAGAADDACAASALAPLGRFLFRRPLSAGETAFYVKLAGEASRKSGSFWKGLELSLGAMLVSSNYLYIIERGEPDPAHPGSWRLDNRTRATRLSMMLWNSTPNAALLKSAEEGRLTDPAQLNAIAAAMVNSPRFEQGVRAFFADMLLFEKFDDLAKDPVVYPYFNQEVAAALPEQTLRSITDLLLTRNGDYRQIFTTNRSFMTRVLGPLYQVPVHRSSGWEAHDFAPGDDRAGILGQAGFLSIYSHSGRSSPTLRGRAIREVLMCQPVPNPPGNVNFTAVQDVHNVAMPTARNRLTSHATDPTCAGCHKITDPVGLSLEKFDGIGAFRSHENGAAIDSSGQVDGTGFQGAEGLGKLLADNPATTQCVATRALEYALGKPSADDALITAITRKFGENGYSIRSLFLQAATMPEMWRVKSAAIPAPAQVSLAAANGAPTLKPRR